MNEKYRLYLVRQNIALMKGDYFTSAVVAATSPQSAVATCEDLCYDDAEDAPVFEFVPDKVTCDILAEDFNAAILPRAKAGGAVVITFAYGQDYT